MRFGVGFLRFSMRKPMANHEIPMWEVCISQHLRNVRTKSFSHQQKHRIFQGGHPCWLLNISPSYGAIRQTRAPHDRWPLRSSEAEIHSGHNLNHPVFSPRNPRALEAGSAPGYEVPRVAGIAGIAGTAGSKCCVLQTCVRDALVGGRHVDARWRTGRSVQQCMGGRIAGSWWMCSDSSGSKHESWRFPNMGLHPNHPLIGFSITNHPFWGIPIYEYVWYVWKPPYQQSAVLWLLWLWHRVCFEGSFYRGLRLQVLYQLHRGKQRSGLVPMVTYGNFGEDPGSYHLVI